MICTIEQRDLYARIRSILSNPAHWTKGAYGRTSTGEDFDPLSEDCVCWCVLGAAEKAYNELHPPKGCYRTETFSEVRKLMRPFERFISERSNTSIITWNDTSEHSDILKAFDEVLEEIR